MNLLTFKNKSAQRVYKDYLQRCKNATKILSVADQEDCLLEINSHIYEFLSVKSTEDEMESLLDILDRLGPPEETLKEIVAIKKIGEATRTFNPKHLIQALFLNITNGVIYIILFLLFLFELCFPALIILKLIYPGRVGFFIYNNRTFRFGYLEEAGRGGFGFGYFNPTTGTEIIGNWFIPITIILTVFIYIFIVLLLKAIRTLKAK